MVSIFRLALLLALSPYPASYVHVTAALAVDIVHVHVYVDYVFSDLQ